MQGAGRGACMRMMYAGNCGPQAMRLMEGCYARAGPPVGPLSLKGGFSPCGMYGNGGWGKGKECKYGRWGESDKLTEAFSSYKNVQTTASSGAGTVEPETHFAQQDFVWKGSGRCKQGKGMSGAPGFGKEQSMEAEGTKQCRQHNMNGCRRNSAASQRFSRNDASAQSNANMAGNCCGGRRMRQRRCRRNALSNVPEEKI
eukprot:768628-Hanusia_phi.AAC.16